MKTEYIIQMLDKGYSDIWFDAQSLGNPYKTCSAAEKALAKIAKKVNYEYRIVRRTEEVVDLS